MKFELILDKRLDGFLIPRTFEGTTPELVRLIEAYFHAFENPGDDETSREWKEAAVAVAAFPSLTPIDLAAKMIVQMHEAYPGTVAGGTVIGNDLPSDTAEMFATAMVNDALALAKPRDWDTLLSEYRVAKAVEDAFDAAHVAPHWKCGVGHENVSQAILDEMDRLQGVRHDAEDRMMACPSPDCAAFAMKYLVAFGDGREANQFSAMLEAEAKHFSGSGEGA